MLDDYESFQARLHAGVGALGDTDGSAVFGLNPSTSTSAVTTPRERIRFRMEWPLSRTPVGTSSTRSFVEICRCAWIRITEILAASHLSTSVIHRISILLIVGEFLVRRLQEYLEEVIKSPNDTLEIQVVWLAPIFTTIASFSFFLSLMVQLRPTSHAVILIGVISLALVECLVPVALTGCTALFWFDVFSAETALLVLFVVWVAASVSSRCIRCVLYPNLGHG